MSSSEQRSGNANSNNPASSEDDLSPYPDNDTFRILLVTDTHLGHLERDEYRRYDSFRAFDEALSIGKQYNVDFVLHAGDLFDKNQPSRFTMVKTIQILRKHCFGNKPIHFEIISDQTQNFPSTGCVNYQDPNYNISLPIFIQHGNHDDPAGLGNHAALEQLSATNLVNYVGRVDDLENIQIFPILMKKGSTKIAVYPLGFIRDERLHRAFLHHKVKWVKPKNSQNMKDWFNIGMMHQNRTRHAQQYKDCIPEEFLPKFLDVVYWGHEHECIIDLTESLSGNFYVTQPGSTVITSLSQSETKPKYCGIMEIKGESCRLVPKKLETIRPFIWDDIVLEDHFEKESELHQIDDFLADKVNELIAEAHLEHPPPSQAENAHLSFITNYTEVNEEQGDISRFPLVRLRVDYTGFPKLRSAQFGQQFHGKVANPDEILLLHKRLGERRKRSGDDEKDQEALRQVRGGNLFNLATGRSAAEPIEEIVSKNITSDSNDALIMFPELDLLKAITDYVEKEDNNAIETYCEEQIAAMEQKLIETKCLAEESEIRANAAKFTGHRRKVLQQQREMQLLQREQELEEKRNANIMDLDEVQRVADGGGSNSASNSNRNRNVNVKQQQKQHDEDDDGDDELMLFPKKKKANLNSFGFGNASQRIKEDMIANSQHRGRGEEEEEEEENDDDLDLDGLDELMKSPKHETRRNEPARKKRKLQSQDDVNNDVLDSLLGLSDDDEKPANPANTSYVITDIPQSLSMRNDAMDDEPRGEQKNKIKKKDERNKRGKNARNAKIEMHQEEDEIEVINTQQSTQSTQRRKARGRGRKKNTAAAWGSLLQGRAGRK